MGQGTRTYHVVHLTEVVHEKLKSAATERRLTMGELVDRLLDAAPPPNVVVRRRRRVVTAEVAEVAEVEPARRDTPPWARPPFWAGRNGRKK